MKSCPGCEFLIDDVQEVCEFCAADPGYAAKLRGYTTKTVVGALADEEVGIGGTVGVLERPVPSGVNWSETDLTPPEKTGFSLRSDGFRAGGGATGDSKSSGASENIELRKQRKPIPLPVFAVMGLLALVAVTALSVTGHGPLAGSFAKLGLGRVQAEVFPAEWRSSSAVSEIFTADLPVGANVVFEGLDPSGAIPGGIVGLKVDGAQGAWMMASTTDMGLGAGVSAYDTSEGVAELAAKFASVRIDGESTMSRSQLLPTGHVNDSLYVSKGADGTTIETRLRVMIVGQNMVQMVTSGPSSAATELDAAHRRLIDSVVVKR